MLFDENLDLLKKLVEFDTSNPPGREKSLALYLEDFLNQRGFECHYVSTDHDRGSIVATKKFSEDGPKLVFNGHLDVVPVNDGWSKPPFELTLEGGRAYGRGTSDMKAGVSSMITAALARIDSQELCGELSLHFVADEEENNKGTKSLFQYWQDADYVVVGEPTNLELNIAHRGSTRYRLKFKGISCHSSSPNKGDNAIYKAAKAISAVADIHRSFSQDLHSVLPNRTIAATMISGGHGDNTIPDSCTLTIDRRTFPGEKLENVNAEIVSKLKDLDLEVEKDYTLENYMFLGAGEVAENSSVVALAQKALAQINEEHSDVTYFGAACEQSFFTDHGIEAIVFGPGSLEQAHTVDEYVPLCHLDVATQFYINMIDEILGQ